MKKPIRLIALILSILTLLPATCSYNGYCADIADLPYPNFEMPWWPESLLDDPVYLVRNHKWTLDALN